MKMTKVLMLVCAMVSVLGISSTARAALISEGTGYGSDVSFKTSYAPALYVSPSGVCMGKSPCYDSIQEAINAASTGSLILIEQGTYYESLVLNESKTLTLKGGWDSTFTFQSSHTKVNSITVTSGDLYTENLGFEFTANAGAGGTISPSGEVFVNYASDQSFTITPDSGYQISDVLLDGSSVGAVVSHTCENVTMGHTIDASFDEVATSPVAGFTGSPTSGHVPLTVNFNDQSTGAVTSWEWAFGDDNATSTEQNPTHVYNDAGTYTVSLTLKGPGGSDTETKTDYITVNPDLGTLKVILSPQGAIDGGAQWKVDAGDWQDSGTTVSGLEPGEHTINYKDVIGWTSPISEIVTITEGETKEITRSYDLPIFCVSNAGELQTALTTAASNGEDDIIRMVQGTYNGHFSYASYEANSLTVEGGYTEGCASREIDPTNTVLDGGGIDTVLALISQGAANFSVEGLTLQNGNPSTVDDGGGLYARTEGGYLTLTNNAFIENTATSGSGGGVFVYDNNTLINNTFSGNTANGRGGGAYVGNNSTLTDNTFSGNTATSGSGGGAYVRSGNLTNNTFVGNSSRQYGGGAWVSYGSLTGNIFTKNSAGWYGGGVRFYKATLLDNSFNGNAAGYYGGGAFAEGRGFGTLIGNTFANNNARDGGGVYYHTGSEASLINNIFTENGANNSGGGLKVYDSKGVLLANNTIIRNSANTGGGVWISFKGDYPTGKLYNNIIWNSKGSEATDLYIYNRGDVPFLPVPVNLFNNDFDQSATGTYIEIPFTIDPSNLDNQDPLFVSSDNCHLTPSSPCTNAGNNYAPGKPAKDKDGNPRISGGTVDMGAYEYNPSAPIADAGADQIVVGGENVLLDGSNSSDPEGEPLTYLWTQTAGVIVTLSDVATVQPTFTAPDVGLDGDSLTFQLTVADTSNLRNTDSVIVNVTAAEPVAHFEAAPTQGAVPLSVNFTDQSTGSITSWDWDFGDGGTSTEENPSYAYETPGTYTVSLTVKGPVGTDTEVKPDYITATSSPYGSLTVTITPQAAVDAGAQWNFDSGEWQESGATVSGMSVGTHTVSYKIVIGWDPPSSEFVTINDGQTTETTGTYTKTAYSPSVATGSASDISLISARLNGTVNPNGTETTVVFEYGTNTSYGFTTPETSAGSGSGYVAVSSAISGLSSKTTYHFRVKATNSAGASYGDDKSFTTLSADIIYVEPGGVCGGKSPCFATIKEGVAYGADGATINIAEGSYDEDIILDEPKDLILLGGWDTAFTAQTSYTTATGLIIRQGKIITYNLILRP